MIWSALKQRVKRSCTTEATLAFLLDCHFISDYKFFSILFLLFKFCFHLPFLKKIPLEKQVLHLVKLFYWTEWVEYFEEAWTIINHGIYQWQFQMNTFIGPDKYITKSVIYLRCWHIVPDVGFKPWLSDCSWKLHWHFKKHLL